MNEKPQLFPEGTVVFSITKAQRIPLEEKAAKRGISVRELLRRIAVTLAADAALVDAVLDDGM